MPRVAGTVDIFTIPWGGIEVNGKERKNHDKRMNDCLPPILFSAIFKLLKVLPDTELDAC